MKAAPVIRALATRGMQQRLVHTGQHYDATLSDVFFTELGLPAPDANLGVGSGSQAGQTATLLVRLEEELQRHPAAIVVVYGDVNSTLAAAIVAAKLLIPIAHVEAGLRSHDNSMPEEINRRVTDLLSDLLFTSSPEAADNLAEMGIPAERVHFVGNVMIDTLFANLHRLNPTEMRQRLSLPDRYAVATVHRPSNVDEQAQAMRVVTMLERVSEVTPIVIPLHPRGRRILEGAGLRASPRIRLVEPLGYLDFLSLVSAAALVVTDSGGIQEETTVLGVPCFTIRPNTERPITITHGTNRLVEPEAVPGAAAAVMAGVARTESGTALPDRRPPLWDGHASERIAAVLAGWLALRGG
jgi:UDP-N-acetylglucosamine 2-epimerase (non-hydrolysing)